MSEKWFICSLVSWSILCLVLSTLVRFPNRMKWAAGGTVCRRVFAFSNIEVNQSDGVDQMIKSCDCACVCGNHCVRLCVILVFLWFNDLQWALTSILENVTREIKFKCIVTKQQGDNFEKLKTLLIKNTQFWMYFLFPTIF